MAAPGGGLTLSSYQPGSYLPGRGQWPPLRRWMLRLARSRAPVSAADRERLVDHVRDRPLVAGHLPGRGPPDQEGGQRGLLVLPEEARRADLPVGDETGEAVTARHRVELENPGQV